MTAPEVDTRVAFIDLFTGIGNYFFDAWVVMVVLTTLHHANSVIPMFGYWNSFFIVVAVQSLLGTSTYHIYQRLKSITPMYGKRAQLQLDGAAIRDALSRLGSK